MPNNSNQSLQCKKCGHNMGRSRCRVIDGAYGVRCNKCKTVHTIHLRFPKDKNTVLQAKIIITVQYASYIDMQEAKDDKKAFSREIEQYFGSSLDSMKDMHIDYTIAEVQRHD